VKLLYFNAMIVKLLYFNITMLHLACNYTWLLIPFTQCFYNDCTMTRFKQEPITRRSV